jgi:alpha-glucosidase/alpha-D-xyloside xylohydrolase
VAIGCSPLSRRDLIKRAGVVATGAVFASSRSDAQTAPIQVAGRPVELTVTPATARTIRISIAALENGRPQPIPDDGSLVPRTWPQPVARLIHTDRPQTVRASAMTLQVSFDPVKIAIASADGRAIQSLEVEPATGALTFALGTGPLLGLGEGGPQFDRKGSSDRMRSGQGGYQLRTHGGRVPIAWLVGTDGWAMFVHHPLGTFDFTGDRGRFDSGGAATALPLDLFIVGAKDPAEIVTEYARLTGFPELPPRWAFGYQQSHRTLASREEILQEAKTFREKKLPCDTLIYLGTGFCPSGWNTDNGEFDFNKKVFPDPAAMIRHLHDDHFKVVVHVVLEGRRLTGTVSDPCTAAPLPSGRTPDGRWPDDRQASCYWPVHKPILDAGVDGWWPDQGDGLDAPSRLARNRMYWDGSRLWRPNERPYALHRNGHAGMQRYAAFLWSGDVYSTWETLATHVSVAINTALTGIPYWGTDIGGFVPTKEFTGELYVRWFQFGAFCPLFRSHGRTWKLRLPWGWNTGELGPDEIANYTGGAANPDSSELHNREVEPICRKYLELRSRLMPYLYSAVHEGHATGMPILRALWLHYPDDRIACARSDEYLWGRDLLVAPVTKRGATSRDVYLPRGRWVDFWTEASHEGGHEIARDVDLGTLPLFVRAGTILPLDPVRQYAGEEVSDPMTVQIYPGADGTFTLYDDDGVSFGYQRGDWMGIDMRWIDRQRTLELRLTNGSRFRSPARQMRVRLVGSTTVRDLTFGGTPVSIQL